MNVLVCIRTMGAWTHGRVFGLYVQIGRRRGLVGGQVDGRCMGNEWMDGGKRVRTNEKWMGARTDGRTDRRTDGRMHGQTDGPTDRLTDPCTHTRTHTHTHACMYVRAVEWSCGRLDGHVDKWVSGWVVGWPGGCMNGWTELREAGLVDRQITG